MAANNELSELEQQVFEFIQYHGSVSDLDVLRNIRGLRSELLQAIANLLSRNMIQGSHDTPIRYEISRLEDRAIND